MAKFVEVHANNEAFLLNIENVNYFVRNGHRCAFYGMRKLDNDFCSYGERKDGDGNG